MALKISIDRSRCAGHARCNAVGGGLFPLNDDGYIATDGFEVPSGEEVTARRGARACPERVISVLEE